MATATVVGPPYGEALATEGGSANAAPKTYEVMISAFVITALWFYSCHVFVKSWGGWIHLKKRCLNFAQRCVGSPFRIKWAWSERNKRRAKLRAKQVQRVRAGVLFSCFAWGASAVLYFLASVLPRDPVISFSISHNLAIVGFWLGFIFIYVMSENPCWQWSIGIPYHVCMMILTVHVMPWSSVSDERDIIHFMACFFRFACLPLAADILSVTLWSGTISSFVWYKHPELGPMDVVYTAVTMAAYWWLRRATEAEAACELEMADLRSMRHACHSLLSSVCDAVVELDESLNISEDVHRLGAWLVHGRLDHLQGQDMQQFLHSDLDRDTFFKEVSRKCCPDIAAAFHVKMRDGSGMAIPAQCFHAQFESDSEEKHLIAFRQFSDGSMLSPIARPLKELAEASDIRDDVKKMQMSGGVPVIEFNALNFETLGATAAFCDKFHGDKLLNQQVVDYLPEKARERFLQDVTLMSNELLNSTSTLAEVEQQLLMLVKGEVCKCFCRMTVYKCNEARLSFNERSIGEQKNLTHSMPMFNADDFEDERVIVKLFVMEIEDDREDTRSWTNGSVSSSGSGHSFGSRKSRSRSSTKRTARTSKGPECGDLRALNRRSRSAPVPL